MSTAPQRSQPLARTILDEIYGPSVFRNDEAIPPCEEWRNAIMPYQEALPQLFAGQPPAKKLD